jgi:hypothetical protein
MALAQKQTRRQMEQNRKPRNKYTQLYPSDRSFLTKEPEIYTGEKTALSTNGAEKIGYL